MGRGLSELQKTILRLALDGHTRTGNQSTHVRYAEVLVEHFKFPIKRKWWNGTKDMSDLDYVRKNPASQKFDSQEIGPNRYNSAKVSVSRAFARLGERGLLRLVEGMFSSWSGANLTDDGLAIAMVLRETHDFQLSNAVDTIKSPDSAEKRQLCHREGSNENT